MGKVLPIPKQPKVVTLPPLPPPPPPVIDSSKNDEAEQSRRRAQALLERERSRLGTVLTSFSGVLRNNDQRPQRKTLLGE